MGTWPCRAARQRSRLDQLSTGNQPQGGAMHFGEGGRLISRLEKTEPATRRRGEMLGKILRIKQNGGFTGQPVLYRSCRKKTRDLALGRGSRAVCVRPVQRQHVINMGTENTYDEINDGISGSELRMAGVEGTDTREPSRDHYVTATPPRRSHCDFEGGHTGARVTGGVFTSHGRPVPPSCRRYFLRYCGG